MTSTTRKLLWRSVSTAAVATVGMVLVATGEAASAPLPGGHTIARGIGSEAIQTWRSGEFATPVPSVANNGAGRAAVLSGTYRATATAGVNGNLAVKVLVGCQVDITGLEGGVGLGVDIAPSASLSGSLTVPLTPGQVAQIDVTDKDIKAGGTAAIQLDRVSVNVERCGGYASARTIVLTVGAKGYSTEGGTVNGTGGYMQSTLYGKPFSLN